MTNRHELKYLVSIQQMEMIKNRIRGIMQTDPYVTAEGYYNIRSVYFDDYDNSCYYANENGLNLRKKYRIRIYNHSTETIHLECKEKINGKTIKKACEITEETAQQLIQGKSIEDLCNCPSLLKAMYADSLRYDLKPKIIVDYDRVPFVYKEQNVRLTFDTHISSSKEINHFFHRELQKRTVLPIGTELMEVKFDTYFPGLLMQTVGINGLRQTAFSKYYLCRKYSL